MTYFSKDKFSSCEVAGAVAEAAIHDLRANLFSFSGFPQIEVLDPIDNVFTIKLTWNSSSESQVFFELTRAEAKTAVKKFKIGKGFDETIFDRVQSALAKLESKTKQ